MRLFIFESHPVQYHAPVYAELARLCASSGHQLRVYYATDVSLKGHYDPGFQRRIAWDQPLLTGYDAVVLNNVRGEALKGFRSLTGHGIHQLLKREHPDAVLLTTLGYAFDWTAYWSARRLRIPIWLRTETHDEGTVRSRWKSLARRLIYRFIYGGMSRLLAIGQLNRQHFLNHGVREEKIGSAPYCVVDRFAGMSEEQRKRIRSEQRQELGIDGSVTLLMFCGKLQPIKNPERILEVLGAMPEAERSRYAVLYVGTGELESRLRSSSAAAGPARVLFVGFKNQSELPPYYLAADILVLPSRRETWGLVVNEAIHAGMSVIVSQQVGCYPEFSALPTVKVFDGSREELVNTVRALAGGERRAFPQHMARYSVAAAAEGILAEMDRLQASKP